MTIPQLIQLAERRISYLVEARTGAERIGDVDQIVKIDAEIAQTQETLNQLQAI